MKKTLFALFSALFIVGCQTAPQSEKSSNETFSGKITRDYWTNKPGDLKELQTAIKNKLAPNGSDTLSSLESVSWKDPKKTSNWDDNYWEHVYGYIVPDKDGEYIFWIASDDQGELRLSTDESEANLKLIASVSEWASQYEWNKYPEQKSAPVKLKAGQKYYVDIIHRALGGGDDLAIGWAISAPDAKPVIIPGKNLLPANKK